MQFAFISEIFSSIQGEGLLCGTPMLFIRFSGCNLKCSYCDTGYARKPGQKYSLEKILPMIKRKAAGVKWISITGGEPLLQHEFLALLLPRLKKSGYKIYLETNGTLPAEFGKIKKYIDLSCWNYKFFIKSRGGPLNSSCSRKSLTCKLVPDSFFFKAVITENTPEKAVLKLYKDIKNTGCPLVLMPVRRKGGHSSESGNLSYCNSRRAIGLAIKYTKLLSSKGLDARLIPGFHTFLRIK